MRTSRAGTVRMRLWLGVGVAVAAVAAIGVLGGAGGAAIGAAAKPTLAVAVVGGGSVRSKPAGIACPGKCLATFAAGSRVLLTQKARTGSRFLRWGGDCTGAGACRVKVSALAAVAAQFVGPKAKPPSTVSVEPGAYSGPSSRGFPVTFFVPAGGGSVLNFSPTAVNVNCAGGGGAQTPFKILKATIKPDRSFTARTSESGVVNGADAKFTYVVTGRFQGVDAKGAATAAGVYREDIVFTDTPTRKCTSNDLPWTATRSLGPPRTSIEPGTYSGPSSRGFPVTFFVPAGGGSVLNFSPTAVNVNCAGGGGAQTPFKILKATIKPDRSFTARTSESGVVNGANAKLTYFVTGYFQGPNANGAGTAAGVYREDIVFTDTPTRKCTSNNLPWTAARSG